MVTASCNISAAACQCGIDLVNVICTIFEDRLVSLACTPRVWVSLGASLSRSTWTSTGGLASPGMRCNHAKGCREVPHLAEAAYQSIARVHYYEDRLPEALDTVEKARKDQG